MDPRKELTQYVETAFNHYICDDHEEFKTVMKQLKKHLVDLLKKKSEIFPKTCYDMLLVGILEQESENFNRKGWTPNNLEIIAHCLSIIGTTFYQTEANQNAIGENPEFMRILMKLWDQIFYLILKEDSKPESECLPQDLISSMTLSCLTLFANMMTNNSTLRLSLWDELKSRIGPMVMITPWKEAQMGCSILHHFFLVPELKQNVVGHTIISSKNFGSILLELCAHQSPTSCFPEFCVEELLSVDNIIEKIWRPEATMTEKLTLLEILTKSVERRTLLNLDIVRFLIEEFKKYGDQMLRMKEDEEMEYDPMVASHLLSFITSAASSEELGPTAQEDKSLLITSIYLLRCMTEIGQEASNIYSRVTKDDLSSDEEINPTFGFKCDLVRLIGALADHNVDNQNIIRENNGILLLLENAQIDYNNPTIRECVILALSFIVKGNPENQEFVKNIEYRGQVPNETTEKLGLTVEMEDGKPVGIRQVLRNE